MLVSPTETTGRAQVTDYNPHGDSCIIWGHRRSLKKTSYTSLLQRQTVVNKENTNTQISEQYNCVRKELLRKWGDCDTRNRSTSHSETAGPKEAFVRAHIRDASPVPITPQDHFTHQESTPQSYFQVNGIRLSRSRFFFRVSCIFTHHKFPQEKLLRRLKAQNDG